MVVAYDIAVLLMNVAVEEIWCHLEAETALSAGVRNLRIHYLFLKNAAVVGNYYIAVEADFDFDIDV